MIVDDLGQAEANMDFPAPRPHPIPVLVTEFGQDLALTAELCQLLGHFVDLLGQRLHLSSQVIVHTLQADIVREQLLPRRTILRTLIAILRERADTADLDLMKELTQIIEVLGGQLDAQAIIFARAFRTHLRPSGLEPVDTPLTSVVDWDKLDHTDLLDDAFQHFRYLITEIDLGIPAAIVQVKSDALVRNTPLGTSVTVL